MDQSHDFLCKPLCGLPQAASAYLCRKAWPEVNQSSVFVAVSYFYRFVIDAQPIRHPLTNKFSPFSNPGFLFANNA